MNWVYLSSHKHVATLFMSTTGCHNFQKKNCHL